MGERRPQQAHVERADDLAGRIADRFVGRDVPVVDHECRFGPNFAAVQDRLGDRRAELGADRPRAVLAGDVGRNPQVAHEDGDGADFLALVDFAPEDLLLDGVDDFITPIEQVAAVQDSRRAPLFIKHGHGRGGHHPRGAEQVGSGPGGLGGNDPNLRPFGQARPFGQQSFPREDDGPRNGFPPARCLGHQRVG